MKHRISLCVLLICVAALCCLGVAFGEEAAYHYFPEKVWCHVRIDVANMAFDAAFYADGHLDGVYDDGEEAFGRYVIRPDGTLIAATDRVSFELVPREDGSYAGTGGEGEGIGNCELTEISEKTYEQAMKAAGLELPIEDERLDLNVYDYPQFVTVTAPEGIALCAHPLMTDEVVTTLPYGTVARVLGDTGEGEFLLEAGGLRGFTTDEEYEDVPVRHAKVVKTKGDKGKSVNLRGAPEYADNIIREIPYGKTVDIFPLTEGEFTMVYYDYNEGWMTTVRLKPIDD